MTQLTASSPRPSWCPPAMVALLVASCALFGGADSSWAPLSSADALAAMKTTLASPSDGPELPGFAVEQQQLPSGLRVAVEPAPSRGLVAVVLVVGAGSSDDPPGREGLAHLVEHLVYRARGRDGHSVSSRLVRLGAHYNADTSLDTTRYHEAAPAASLTALLGLAAERLNRPLAGIDETDLERERSIVENEINQRNELGVYGQVLSWMQGAVFPAGHPYARPVGGSTSSLRRITLADARAFASAHYRPENATLLVSGEMQGPRPLSAVIGNLPLQLRTKSAAAAVTRMAGVPVPDAAPGGTTPSPPDVLRAAVARPEIWLTYNLGGGTGPDAAVRKVLTASAAEEAVRERLLREDGVLDVSFQSIELRRVTLLACQVVLADERRRDELAHKARSLVWSLWSDRGPPAAIGWDDWHEGAVLDLRRAAQADAVLASEPFLERALARALLLQTTGAADAYDRLLKAIGDVRPEAVSSRAFELLAPERARTLYLEPLPAGDRPRPGPVGVAGAGPGVLEVGASGEATDLGAPPRSTPPEGLDRATTTTLPNGLTVVVVPRHRFPSVTALLGFHGGGAALPAGVLELVRAVEPRRAESAHTGALRIEQADGAGYTADLVRTDRRHVPNALFLLADRIKAIAETNWRALLSRAQSRAWAPRSPAPMDPRRIAAARMRAALWGEHPYGRHLTGDDLRKLPPSLPGQWLPRLYNPRNAVLVMVGDVDPAEAARQAAGWFGDWRSVDGAARLQVPPVPATPTQAARAAAVLVPRPVASQVEVTFGCRMPPASSPHERATVQMVAGLLGGVLTDQIRERAGAAYTVDSAGVVTAGGGAHLLVEMAVAHRRLREVLATLSRDVDSFAAGRIDRGTLSQVRWGLGRTMALRHMTTDDTAERVFRSVMLGWPLDSLAGEADELMTVTAQDLARAFSACRAHPVLALVGDEDVITAATTPMAAIVTGR